MRGGVLGFCFVLAVLTANAAFAETVEIDTCVDASGRQIAAEADAGLRVLAKAGQRAGETVIRYNPDLLPDLSVAGRQFFYAYECARAAQGQRSGGVRAADCAAAQMLITSGTLGQGASLSGLQAALVFSDEEWKSLPGPRRRFDFASCSRSGGLMLPEGKPATPQQRDWDACVRQCGDRLYHCPGKGAGGGCQETYDRCYAGCGGH